MMKGNLEKKILALAAQICRMHGGDAGGRICQDWTGDTAALDSLTAGEKNLLQYQYEQHNSDGADYEPGYFPYDEMLLSFIVARALEVMATGELPSGGRARKDLLNMIEYKTVIARHSIELDERVNEEIAEGWRPLGGVSIAAARHAYAQAMLRPVRARDDTEVTR